MKSGCNRVRFCPRLLTLDATRTKVVDDKVESMCYEGDTCFDDIRWYSRQELHHIVVGAVEEVIHFHDQSESNYALHSALETDAKDITPAAGPSEDLYAERRATSFRWLELLLSAETTIAMLRSAVIDCVPWYVLKEQQRQRRVGVHDPTALAHTSAMFSRFSAEYAAKVGLENEQDVLLNHLQTYHHHGHV